MDRRNTFKIYEVEEDLKIYTATLKDRKYGILKTPLQKYRVYSKEICSSEEVKKEDDENYNSEEDGAESFSESEPEVADERKSKSKTGDILTENSRNSLKEINKDLLQKESRYSPDDLVQRESMMIFSSMIRPKPLTLDDFEIVDFLGQGTFGKVYLTKLKSTGKLYAIKCISKEILIEYDQEENTKLEEQILFTCKHEFLLGMDFVFQNIDNIYFVMPYVKGGELYAHLKKEKRFPEYAIKFYAVQIILGIGYLHEKGIIHRDMKLENILVDEDGYLKIIDFGLAKILKNEEETMTY